jgi:carbamoyl-phosphate synthase large subunit
MQARAVGRHLCDDFELVPPGSDPGYAEAVLDLCHRHGATVVLPQSSYDLPALADERVRFATEGIASMVASPEAVRRANDNGETFALLEACGVRGPEWRRVRGGAALAEGARELGYPARDVCMKPVVSSGSRGFRILSARVDRRRQLLFERPGGLAMRLDDVVEILGDDDTELLVMELARGEERTIDGFARDGRVILGHPKTREGMRAGLAMFFRTLQDPFLDDVAAKVVGELHLDHFFNVQLVGDHVIEINPRISTIVYQPDFNLPWLGVKYALGELSEDEAAAAIARVRPGRQALRYFEQLEYEGD